MAPSTLDLIRKLFGHKFPRWGSLGYKWFLRQRPDRITTELFPGVRLSLDLNDDAQRTFYYYGDRYEFPTGSVLASWCSGASLFFDIGANLGFFSLLLRSKCIPIRIIAFEPNPLVNGRLKQIIEENQLSDITVENFGLSNLKAVLPLHPGQENDGQSTFGQHPLLSKLTVAHAEVLPFDSYCDLRGIKLPDKPEWVAKIDVEGFDLKVLEGMSRALEHKAFKGIAVEVNEFNLSFCEASAEKLRKFLTARNYRQLTRDELPKGHTSTDNEFYVPDAQRPN
ncbi:MAG: FkbM family methyltransferase [Verrucomicrobiales bacterium]|nr:FkbM family methyltransferase [Verrucomicrobiales bacterium]